MDFLSSIWTAVTAHIDPVIVALVLLGGFFSKRYLFEVNIKEVYKTFIVGTLITCIYLLLLKLNGQFYKADYTKYFVSYTVATSLYEILFKQLSEYIANKFKGQ